MCGLFSRLKSRVSGLLGAGDEDFLSDIDQEYVELDTEPSEIKGKVVVRPFSITDFSEIKPVLDALREGTTVAILNIKPLKEKDIIELKRAINRLKKTIDAVDGDIAGFGEDFIVATPSFARVYRTQTHHKTEGSETEDLI
ncbi:hypothetical protein COV22_01280 [Candidatus Woesearchaeota archaeon CG10_big_fil_rev_8_21_14_0_10_47_5]|nr:MAG: hypothetical protein AUJ69_00185 [Candidatus Woesearchaeota archaeon CG1_02_47_18]PIN73816.1 MAG: hypothetical protein COV22_01280 [Candidatus Woesearchaeota archaeon CG10_big_fil_rev_8_21_14_0_10_47_5]